MYQQEYQRTYLKLGDQVIHNRYPEWGKGVVVEEKASSLSGGICFVRVIFRDGKERSFINDLNDHNCCYYAGVRLYGSDY
jgi:predicted DNA binding protein